MTADLADRFCGAMRRTASAVAVLATDGPAGRGGLTVSTLCSLSLEPPSVIACIHRDARVLPTIIENGVFTANVLAEDQEQVARAFAGQIPEFRDNRFAAGTWAPIATGAPALAGALTAFDCRLKQTFDFGSHRIVIGEVVDLAVRETEPLVYRDGGFHRLQAA